MIKVTPPECLGCFGGRYVSNGSGSTERCFRCKGSGNEPACEIEFVDRINGQLLAKRLRAA